MPSHFDMQPLPDVVHGIFGAGAFAREARRWLRDGLPRAFVVFIRHGKIEDGELLEGCPVVSPADFVSMDATKLFTIAVADPLARFEIWQTLEDAKLQPFNIIHPSAYVAPDSVIAPGAIICPGAVVCPGCVVGRFFHMNINAVLGHDAIVRDFVTVSPCASINGWTELEEFVYIGANATMREGSALKRIRVGVNSMLGMGAVGLRDIPAGEIWIGNPAKRLRESDRGTDLHRANVLHNT